MDLTKHNNITLYRPLFLCQIQSWLRHGSLHPYTYIISYRHNVHYMIRSTPRPLHRALRSNIFRPARHASISTP